MLGVPVSFFFDEAPGSEAGASAPGFAEQPGESYVIEFLSSREGMELNKAFVRIGDAKVRRAIVELVRSLAGEE